MLKYKKILILSLIFILFGNIKGQQLPLTNQYVFAPGLINPASITVYNKMELFGLLRNQWTDIKGAPSNQIITINGALKKNKTYLGALVLNDKIGLWNQLSIYGNFSYRAKINDDLNIDFGLSIGGIQRSFDFNRSEVRDEQDPFLISNSLSRFGFDGNFGINVSYKKLKIGFSSLQIFGNKLSYFINNTSSIYALTRQFNVLGQYTYVISDSKKMSISPIIVGRYVTSTNSFSAGAPLQFDANILFDYAKYGWLLVSYKSDYALVAGLGVHVNNSFHFGISYDISMFTPVQSYIGNTIELSFRYTFKSGGVSAPQLLY